jgi:hypothetical protein
MGLLAALGAALTACGPGPGPADGGMGMDSCGVGEPNDVREQATVVALPSATRGACVGGSVDTSDFYEVLAPMDAAGGVVRVAVTNVGADGLPELTVTAAEDNGAIVNAYTTDRGASIEGWFAVAPGARYRVRVEPFAGAARFRYDFNVTYTALNDAFEPNNARTAARPITVGTPIQASAGIVTPRSMAVAADAEDWYRVTLAAGAASVRVTNVPADFLCDVSVFDAAGMSLGERYTTTPGANCELTLMAVPAGEVTIKLEPFSGGAPLGAGGPTPPRYTGQYTLSVTQP